MLMSTELVCQWINTAAFLVPNVALLARPCEYFTVIVRELLWIIHTLPDLLTACYTIWQFVHFSVSILFSC